MKNYPALFVFIALFGAALFSALAAEEPASGNPEYLRLKSTYEAEMRKIDDSDMAVMLSEQEKYGAALAALKKKAQEAGKLEVLIVIDREIERFAAQKKINAENISTDLPDLAIAQNNYMKNLKNLPLGKAGKIIALAQNYDKALVGLQEKLTRANDINSALEVKGERERLAGVPELKAAKELVSEARAASEKVAVKPVVKEVPKPAVAAPAPEKKKYAGSPEKRIRQRFDELCKALLKQDFSKAVEFVDPEFVKEHGEDGLRRFFNGVFPFLQFADDPHRKLSVDSIKLAEEKDAATLVPKLWAGNQWRDLPSNKWIEFEGEWYIDISGGAGREARESRGGNEPRARDWRPFRRK